MADIPGIIEEASSGKGLGIQFLRHIERNKILLFMVSSESDIEYEYKALINELKTYRKDLLDKPRVLAITKMDLKEGYKLEKKPKIKDKVPVILVSSATNFGMDELKKSFGSCFKEQNNLID
jgi:Predicted GTPase